MLTSEIIAKSDSLRIVGDGQSSPESKRRKIDEARAAIQFQNAVAKGCAAVPANGVLVANRRGSGGEQRVFYRSLAGEVYDAVVLEVRGHDRADIDIYIPGYSIPFRLTDIKVQTTHLLPWGKD